MSTEQRPRSDRRFRRALGGSVLALALAAGGLVAATIAQGPRVTSVEVSRAGVVEREGGRMRIRLDQEVDASVAERVRVSPDTPHSVAVDGAEVTVTFTETLRYATEYTVSLAQARGAVTGSTAELTASFTTTEPELFTLDRAVGEPDRVRVRPLSGGEAAIVFEAPRILDYTVVGPVLVAVTALDDGTNSIETVALDTGARGIIPLPSVGTVRELHGSPSTLLVGYTVSTRDGAHDRSLFSYDLTDPKGEPVAATGLDGGPLAARDWDFVPNTTAVIAQTPDDAVLRLDLVQPGAIVPLGQHAELRGFVPGTASLVLANPDAGVVVDLESGTERTLALPLADVTPSTSLGELLLLGGDAYVQTVSEYSDGGSPASFALVLVDGSGTRELYRPAGAGSRILGTCLSPNGQFVAVETVPAGAERAATGFAGATTVLVDVQSGSTNRSVPGSSYDWC